MSIKSRKKYIVIHGPTIIILFESENELKFKNRLHDFIDTLCFISNFLENSLRHFKMIL